MDKCLFCQRVVIEGVDDIAQRGDAVAHRACLGFIRDQYEFLKGWIDSLGTSDDRVAVRIDSGGSG